MKWQWKALTGRTLRLGLAALAIGVVIVLPGRLESPLDQAIREDDRPGAAAPDEAPPDLEGILERGTLRILVPLDVDGLPFLPRNSSPLDFQRDVAIDFARSLGVEPVLIRMKRFSGAIPALLAGHADVVASNLTVTEDREQVISFSLPFEQVREQVITRADDDSLRTPADLKGRTVHVDPSTTFWRTMTELQAKYPGIRLEPHPLPLGTGLLDDVARGAIDVTVLQSNLLDAVLPYRPDLRVAFDVSEPRPIAWALRPDAPRLRAAVNRYLTREKLVGARRSLHTGDLPEIRERNEIRVLLRNNGASYFIWRGELVGFEYDLAREFARRLGVRLRVVVPPTHGDLFRWLLEGRGDLAAGFLSPFEWKSPDGIAFSEPYHWGSQMLIARKDDPIDDVDDLEGRTIVVRERSPYWERLRTLQARGIGFRLEAAPPEMETEEIIWAVASGEFDLTVAGGPIADIDLEALGNARAVFPIGEPAPSSWAVRESNPELVAAANAFLKDVYRTEFYNVTYRKYFGDSGRLRSHVEQRVERERDDRLSPYDDIVRRYAERYDFDWRLIVSQMYQESRFDPMKVSWAGAIGVMQLLPRTAQELGFRKLEDPETGIHAALRYLDWLRDRFADDLPYADRMWFVLAAYNAGLGHVRDARRLAAELGLDPNQWFGHVEKAMLLLSRPRYARDATHGFVRGHEPVRYVREIRNRYAAYLRYTEEPRRNLAPAPAASSS